MIGNRRKLKHQAKPTRSASLAHIFPGRGSDRNEAVTLLNTYLSYSLCFSSGNYHHHVISTNNIPLPPPHIHARLVLALSFHLDTRPRKGNKTERIRAGAVHAGGWTVTQGVDGGARAELEGGADEYRSPEGALFAE
jgi:hypothetical protein